MIFTSFSERLRQFLLYSLFTKKIILLTFMKLEALETKKKKNNYLEQKFDYRIIFADLFDSVCDDFFLKLSHPLCELKFPSWALTDFFLSRFMSLTFSRKLLCVVMILTLSTSFFNSSMSRFIFALRFWNQVMTCEWQKLSSINFKINFDSFFNLH